MGRKNISKLGIITSLVGVDLSGISDWLNLYNFEKNVLRKFVVVL
jgi:hypothetical protein